jgi:hypothetical protein
MIDEGCLVSSLVAASLTPEASIKTSGEKTAERVGLHPARKP